MTTDLELAEKVRRMKHAAQRRIYESWSYQAIADELEVSVGTVRNWVREITVTMLPQEEAEELRKHELAKIDESERQSLQAMSMLGASAQLKLADNKPVTDEVESLRRWQATLHDIRKQRATLLGLNVPVTVQHNVRVRTEFDAEIEGLVADLLGGGNLFTAPDEVDTDAVSTG